MMHSNKQLEDLERANDYHYKAIQDESQFEQPISEKNDSSKQSTKASLDSKTDRTTNPKEISHLFRCGTFVPRSGSKTYKTQKMDFTAFFSLQSIYAAMNERKIERKRSLNQEYSQQRQNYVEWIFEIAEKFKISNISSHLAVCLMDSLYYTTNAHNTKLQLFAPACLLLAAKTIELDERIPFISKLRRVCNSNYSVEEFKKAEQVLLENVDWNPQFTSTLEFLNFFLSQGVVYSSDDHFSEDYEKEALKENTQLANKQNPKNTNKFGPTYSSTTKKLSQKENDENQFSTDVGAGRSPVVPLSKKTTATTNTVYTTAKLSSLSESKILEIVAKIEASAAKLSNAVVKTLELVEYDPEVLACACIAYLREINNIAPRWCDELEELTSISEKTILDLVDKFHKHFDQAMLPGQIFQAPQISKQNSTKSSLNNLDDQTSPSSVTSLDSVSLGPEKSSASRSDVKKTDKTKVLSNSKGNVPPSYTDLPLQTAPHQSGRHNTISYTTQHSHQAENPSYANKYSQPVLMKSQSTNYENSSASNSAL